MTFYDDNNNDEGVEVVPELKLIVEGDDNDVDGKRVKLRQRLLEECEAEERDLLLKESVFSSIRRKSIWYWIKLGILFAFLGLLAAVFLKWVGPFFMDKVWFFFSPNFITLLDFLIRVIYIVLFRFHYLF